MLIWNPYTEYIPSQNKGPYFKPHPNKEETEKCPNERPILPLYDCVRGAWPSKEYPQQRLHLRSFADVAVQWVQAPGPPREPKTMAQYLKTETIGSKGSSNLAILEVQVPTCGVIRPKRMARMPFIRVMYLESIST